MPQPTLPLPATLPEVLALLDPQAGEATEGYITPGDLAAIVHTLWNRGVPAPTSAGQTLTAVVDPVTGVLGWVASP